LSLVLPVGGLSPTAPAAPPPAAPSLVAAASAAVAAMASAKTQHSLPIGALPSSPTSDGQTRGCLIQRPKPMELQSNVWLEQQKSPQPAPLLPGSPLTRPSRLHEPREHWPSPTRQRPTGASFSAHSAGSSSGRDSNSSWAVTRRLSQEAAPRKTAHTGAVDGGADCGAGSPCCWSATFSSQAGSACFGRERAPSFCMTPPAAPAPPHIAVTAAGSGFSSAGHRPGAKETDTREARASSCAKEVDAREKKASPGTEDSRAVAVSSTAASAAVCAIPVQPAADAAAGPSMCLAAWAAAADEERNLAQQQQQQQRSQQPPQQHSQQQQQQAAGTCGSSVVQSPPVESRRDEEKIFSAGGGSVVMPLPPSVERPRDEESTYRSRSPDCSHQKLRATESRLGKEEDMKPSAIYKVSRASLEMDTLRRGLADLEQRLVQEQGNGVDILPLCAALALVRRGLSVLERTSA